MLGAFRGLTTRGRCLIAAGVAAALCAYLLGEKDLLRVAIFLLLLPVLSVVVLVRSRFKLASSRTLTPRRTQLGRRCEARIEVRNMSAMPTSLLLMEDLVPPALGGPIRFTMDRVRPGQSRACSYPLVPPSRGRYQVGPLRLRLADPFGLVELTRSFSATETLLVLPQVVALAPITLAGARGDDTGSSMRSAATRGEDDAATREYRYGDDLRKVHWRSTARVGKLMVRREERPLRAQATLLLDTRRSGYAAGQAADGDVNPSFEWAVSAVASIGVHLLGRGFSVALATDRGVRLAEVATETVLLDLLAEVRADSAGHDFGPVRERDVSLGSLRHAARDRTVIAVLGSMTAGAAQQVLRMRAGATAAMAVLIDSADWMTLDPRVRRRTDALLAGNLRSFRAAGWSAVPASANTRVADAWAATDAVGIGGRTGAAGRSRMPAGTAGRFPAGTAAGTAAGRRPVGSDERA